MQTVLSLNGDLQNEVPSQIDIELVVTSYSENMKFKGWLVDVHPGKSPFLHTCGASCRNHSIGSLDLTLFSNTNSFHSSRPMSNGFFWSRVTWYRRAIMDQ